MYMYMYVYIHLPVPSCIRIILVLKFIIHGFMYNTCTCNNSYHMIQFMGISIDMKIYIYMYSS